ncbi:PEP-CTERM sorting domain-containing protein [Nostoc sp. UHCC 0251]|uniref:PEP-CTERM sorting domain-containing protein n=1 Tax=Nostoc sp. UHCC 0251 TaxID=3110240 RepID=UPI002B1F90CC|nr:PEP-CTERM sorting domain-containing protein [Nostoc sp. UHCC 0251]MEA5623650.1 PEP-CTERM sorting domain-containing protein [Nostoc sp. UHCC 0251]
MISFKSRLLNATLAVAAALPLATAGLFTSAGSAQAYIGSFTFDGDGTIANIHKTGVDFLTNPGRIELGAKKGDFSGDSFGNIYDFLTPLGGPSTLFIDLDPVANGAKELSLTSVLAPTFGTVFGGATISFNFSGVFEDGSKAIGNIDFTTFDFDSEEAVSTAYTAGTTITGSFKGVTVSSVPEPATLLGLGLIGASMTVVRRRKVAKA